LNFKILPLNILFWLTGIEFDWVKAWKLLAYGLELSFGLLD